MSKTATVKLTEKQQEVVNRMAAGWALSHWQGAGRFADPSCSLKHDNDRFAIPSNMAELLKKKGVVEVDSHDWRHATYKLTELGQSLAKTLEAQPTITYWKWFGDELVGEEFVAETDSFLIIEDGRRISKCTEWHTYYPTKDLAIRYRSEELIGRVSQLTNNLEHAKKELDKFMGRYFK